MIYSKLLEELKPEYSIDKKVLYLVHRICQESMFDVRVLYLADDVELHKKIYFDYKDIDKDEDNRLVCNTATHLLQDLLRRININSELVYSGNIEDIDSESHKFPDVALIYQDENGNNKFVNVIGDLTNCKLDIMPAFIGLRESLIKKYAINKPICEIEKKEKVAMAEELGLCKVKNISNFLKLIRDDIKNNNNFVNYLRQANSDDEKKYSPTDILEEKIDFVSRFIPCKMENAGPSEVQGFYMWMLWGHVFDRKEKRYAVKMYNYYKRVGDEVDVINTIQISDNEGKRKYYIYSPSLSTYEKIERAEDFINRIREYKLYDNSKNSERSICD